MPENNYTKGSGSIVRAGRWPPADGAIKVILTRVINGVALDFPVGAEGWTWQMLISRNQYGVIPDLTLTAFMVTRAPTNVMTLCFWASAVQTNTLPGNDMRRDLVHIRSINEDVVPASYSYYAYGTAAVESYVAEV